MSHEDYVRDLRNLTCREIQDRWDFLRNGIPIWLESLDKSSREYCEQQLIPWLYGVSRKLRALKAERERRQADGEWDLGIAVDPHHPGARN